MGQVFFSRPCLCNFGPLISQLEIRVFLRTGSQRWNWDEELLGSTKQLAVGKTNWTSNVISKCKLIDLLMSLVIGVSAIDFERWVFIFVGSTRFNPIGTKIVENAVGTSVVSSLSWSKCGMQKIKMNWRGMWFPVFHNFQRIALMNCELNCDLSISIIVNLLVNLSDLWL